MVGAGANSRRHTDSSINSAQYDRIVTFADCTSADGACFGCMMHTKFQSDELFKHSRVGSEGVGDLFLLEEVWPVEGALGTTTNVPLVKRVSCMMPLEGELSIVILAVPIIAPRKGDMRYFCQHHVRDIDFGHISIEQAICGSALW